MFAYVIRRLLISIVVLFFATILVFLLVSPLGQPAGAPATPTRTSPTRRSSPGSTCSTSTTRCGSATGSGSPTPSSGNLGTTIKGQAVAPQLWSHLFVTLRMVIVATLLAIVLAIVLGVWRAVRQNKLTDHAITVTNFVLLATPVFVLGLALKEFVAIPINQHVGTHHLLHRRRAEPDAQRLLLQPTARLRRPHRAAGPDAHSGLLLARGPSTSARR